MSFLLRILRNVPNSSPKVARARGPFLPLALFSQGHAARSCSLQTNLRRCMVCERSETRLLLINSAFVSEGRDIVSLDGTRLPERIASARSTPRSTPPSITSREHPLVGQKCNAICLCMKNYSRDAGVVFASTMQFRASDSCSSSRSNEAVPSTPGH